MIGAMEIGLPTICIDCPCGGVDMIIKSGVNCILVLVESSEKWEMLVKT